ncbi:hypothetical protein M406DRAFT_89512 [Cryphonectria parasitica EP155]|uniref:Zn(2)-C6 fungal-type domain-containing protein n=1 Tax=Cryphonectria parasitica (strain ATCC 38755 / EP155) TaxID=660469 RepID=A0A9P5CRA4_CRYP1|nr:uncharacterized protein M406DRAFT_89512 [Cryphonectria parasitica EP155]KAF3766895.1 hypothetical protein M406DRAFT_89512 [Cryphonectria parasitica EP155]
MPDLSDPRTSLIKPPRSACHNCRRARLRCDRSVPGCEKCHARGQICLGYGLLLRWTTTNTAGGPPSQVSKPRPLSREVEKDAALTLRPRSVGGAEAVNMGFPSSIQFSLADPLLQDIGPGNRLYISHFDRSVCQDLVSFDREANPFRFMLPLLHNFSYLREIILATSAVHMVATYRSRGVPHQQQLVDALTAKGRAYHLLRQALDHLDPANRPIIMIAVVFFINFDLIESGRGKWKTHIQAAGKLLNSIQSLGSAGLPSGVAKLADIVVADCITYHILGSVFANPEDTSMSVFRPVEIVSALEKAAAFSYGCAAPFVMDILLKASRLSPSDLTEAVALFEDLLAFDVITWVYSIEDLSALDNLEIRVHMANVQRLAACMYILLAVPGVGDVLHTTTDSLHRGLLNHIAKVPMDHPLAKGLVWSTFMAGAQADDPGSRQWCLSRMQAIRFATSFVCPWGYVESAIDMLQRIWEARDRRLQDGEETGNWLQEMRGITDPCLIV